MSTVVEVCKILIINKYQKIHIKIEMKKAILKLINLFSYFFPNKRCNLYVPLTSENFQKILLDLSSTGIVDRSYGLFGSIERRYFVRLLNDDYFRIDGPHAYKKLCIQTQGQIHSINNPNEAVMLDLKMRPATREILMLLIMWLFLLFIVIIGCIVSFPESILPIVLLIWLAFVSIFWYAGTTINFHSETQRIINILKSQFHCE